jgi:hypothetical protein
MLDMPLPTYVAYEKGTRRISRAVAEKVSATWYVSPDYLMQARPQDDPTSISGDALTPEIARRCALNRQFRLDTWNAQHRITKLAELFFLNIHGALHQLSWGLYYSRDKKPARPPKRYRELKARLSVGEKLSDAETAELETLGEKWDKRKGADFKKLRSKGHEATERFLFDALAAIHEVLDRHNLPHEVLPGFDTRYTVIAENILEDPEAPIIGPNGKPIEFRPSKPLREGWKTIAASPLPPADDHERELLRLRQEYHLMDDDKLWEEWRPKLERLARRRLERKRTDCLP